MKQLIISIIVVITCLAVSSVASGQTGCLPPCHKRVSCDIMDVRNYCLKDYRRMMLRLPAPAPEELIGTWRGVSDGLVRLVGYRQFIKEITVCGDRLVGDNIMVYQVNDDQLRCRGWRPKTDPCTGEVERRGKFAVYAPRGCGRFDHGVEFCYRDGGNPRRDPSRVLVDKVVKLDDDHMLGRAVAQIGKRNVPLAYFLLERVK